MTTMYHPSADGQSERTNQLVEIVLRCLPVGKYEATWYSLIPDVERSLNFLPSTSIHASPFETLYGVPPCILPKSHTKEPFLDCRIVIRQAVKDALYFAKVRMAIIL